MGANAPAPPPIPPARNRPPPDPNHHPVDPTLLTHAQPALTPALTLAQSLPEGGMVPLFVALAAGIALWLAGVKIVRLVFLVLGAALGGFVGAVLMPLTGLPSFELGPVTLNPGFTGLIVGGIFGALAAMAMLRLVITFTAAGAMAVAGATAALIFLHFNPTNPSDAAPTDPALAENAPALFDPSPQLGQLAEQQTAEAMDRLNNALPPDSTASGLIDDLNTEENRERIRDAAERSKAYLKGVSDKLRADYNSRPARDKLVILSSTVAGLALGMLIGVAMPKRSAAFVTALGGSALWLAAGVTLIRANADPDPGFLSQPPVTWAVVWAVAAIAGMAIQFGLIKRKGNKPAAEPSDD